MIVLGKIALGLAGTAVAGMGLLCSEGLIQVKVAEKRQPADHSVYVVAPALLVPIGMHFAPKEKMAEASGEIQPWLPTIRAALAELRACDDITFVEVSNLGGQVRVAKSSGAIVVNVNNEEETVHVSVPIRAFASAVEELAAVSPTQTH
jgi:hypothetical protein